MVMMIMAINDVTMCNTLLLTNNILPHKTRLKLKGMILKKGAKNVFFASTHGAPTLVNFYADVELNKDIIVGCPHGKDDV